MGDALLIIISILSLVMGIIWVIAWAKIFIKVGYNPWLTILTVIPGINVLLILWLAYSKWPISEYVRKDWDVKRLKEKHKYIELQLDKLEGEPRKTKETDVEET